MPEAALLVEGEAGIGKTRLAEEFVAYARSRGSRFVSVRCYEGEADLAYGPIVAGLRTAIGQQADSEWQKQLAPHWLSEAARLLPELASLRSDLPPPAPLENPGAQSRFFEGLRQVWLALCANAPAASPGILFFDEVADMPMGTQSKILRVLVDQSFQRVGGTDVVRVDVRVLSATTRDLGREVQAGRFRTELFHRLNVVPVAVPGLEARREDIPELARRFLDDLNATQGLPHRALSPEAEAQLQTMRWPGNVRQLRNTLERALILGPDQGAVEPRRG